MLSAFLAGNLVAATIPQGGGYQSGATLTATQLQSDFEAVEARLAAIEGQLTDAESERDALATRVATLEAKEVGGVKLSSHGVFVAATGNVTGSFDTDGLTGYRAAKARCEVAANSETAHMCSAEEMIRSHQLGVFPSAPGWVSGGVVDERQMSSGELRYMNDCQGWTKGDSSGGAVPYGTAWGEGRPNYQRCDYETPILCCD